MLPQWVMIRVLIDQVAGGKFGQTKFGVMAVEYKTMENFRKRSVISSGALWLGKFDILSNEPGYINL